MSQDLRYSLTGHTHRVISSYENYKLLYHPDYWHSDLLQEIEDDISLLPNIPNTIDNVEVKYYLYDYINDVYNKSELLAFIFASVSPRWDIVKGKRKGGIAPHFWLSYGLTVYDPSLAIVTTKSTYSEFFETKEIIDNKDINKYLKKHGNLYRYYKKGLSALTDSKTASDFSISFIKRIKDQFNIRAKEQIDNVKNQIENKQFAKNNFTLARQYLTKKRKYEVWDYGICAHPDVKPEIIKLIDANAKSIYDMMLYGYKDYRFRYFDKTIGNCYALSIMFNLYDGRFELIQGGFIDEATNEFSSKKTKYFYRHSWLEIDDYVYDPALRIITLKELYYMFFEEKNRYSRKETEEIIKRIGFNFTYFSDFLNNIAVNSSPIEHRKDYLMIDTEESVESGNKLILTIKNYRKENNNNGNKF